MGKRHGVYSSNRRATCLGYYFPLCSGVSPARTADDSFY
jgi:hypothetical protein